MTNKEIKLELAKVALSMCRFTQEDALNCALHNLYDWIVEEDTKVEIDNHETDYDSMDVSEILSILRKNRRRGFDVRLSKIFQASNIKTIGDLIRMGRENFCRLPNVGLASLGNLNDALEELGITW